LSIHIERRKVHNAEQTLKHEDGNTSAFPASSNLNPGDFQFLGGTKNLLRDEQCNDADGLLKCLSNLFDKIPFEGLHFVFHAWIRRLALNYTKGRMVSSRYPPSSLASLCN
jgi:hypothetical protein